jgi:ATP-dependent DNA ligase
VNEILDALALAGGKEGKTKVLRERIINEFNPQEQKWLMRIVFQDLKVGFGFESLLKKIGEEVWQKYDECSSLRTVFETIGVGIKITGLEVMTHFAPMLALGFNKSDSILGQLHSVEAKMKGQPFVMDIKLDGWRMLIHKKGSEVMMMSRRGENWTSDFYPVGKTVIQNIVHEECILDGELIGWDDTDNRHMRFGTCQKVGREEKEALESGAFLPRNAEKPWENQNHWLKFICFDITYIGGEDAKEIATAAGSKFELEEHDENHYEGMLLNDMITYHLSYRNLVFAFNDA